jgi:hypothetical protein
LGVTGQVEQAGHLSDVATLARLSVRVDRGSPCLGRDQADRSPNMFCGSESDAELDTSAADLVVRDQPIEQGVGAARAVGAD